MPRYKPQGRHGLLLPVLLSEQIVPGGYVFALDYLNRKGPVLKTRLTEPDSAKKVTSKGVIQGFAAQGAVNSTIQLIAAADRFGSGSEQPMLPPMIEQSAACRQAHTLITADAGHTSMPMSRG